MSKCHKENIICPKCQARGEFEMWDSVNVDLDPQLREGIFSEDIFIYKCPKCGHETGIPFDTIYHDMTHRFMIFFTFYREEDFKYEPIKLSDIPGLMKDYRYRHVTGLLELKEKIIILEKGLNDIAIERMKYSITHYDSPELSEKGVKLLFGDVKYDNPKHPNGVIVFFYEDENSESHRLMYPLNFYYEQCLACDIDPRMKVNDCEVVDEGWISMKLKSAEV